MRKALAALVACVAAGQLFIAHRYYGFLTGDDVEVLEEAFHRAIGLPHQPWDIRNLFVPDVVVAPVVYVAHAFGVTDRRMLIEIASWPFIALSALTAVLVFALARKWAGDELAAFAAALLFATHWIPLGFGSTVYPRTLATACIVLAALLVDRRPVVAGLLAALAFADRFSEGVFIIPLILIAPHPAFGHLLPASGEKEYSEGAALVGPRPAKRGEGGRRPGEGLFRFLLGTCLGILLFVGVYDWITWGAPFRSLIKFAHLTLVAPDFASRIKYQSPFWYLGNILHWCALTLIALMVVGRRATRWSFVLIPLIALSAIRHKEYRYLQAMIPFLAIAGGAGFAILWKQGKRAIATALLVISVLWDAYGVREFQRKTMPAVLAAQAIDSDPRIHSIAVPQGWALGGKLYFHRPIDVIEVGTPPREVPNVDALAFFGSDVADNPQLSASIAAAGFKPQVTFRDARARRVVLFTK